MTEERLSEENRERLKKFLVQRFRRAAIVTHFGHMDEDKAMESAGIKAAKRVVDHLDLYGPEGREALIPLLEDPEWNVRATTAAYLLKIMPQRAIAVLENVQANGPTPEIRMTAFRILLALGRGGHDGNCP
jgi:HEAT repeat protein